MPEPNRRPQRRMARSAVRFTAAVMVTASVLLIADACATIAWQEPVTALIAWRDRADLDRELATMGQPAAPPALVVGGAAAIREYRIAWARLSKEAKARKAERRRMERQARAHRVPIERDARRRMVAAADRLRRDAEVGDPLGRIRIPALGQELPFVEGTGARSLKRTAGRYPDTSMPGQPGTVGLAGHRTTYGAPFRRISELKRGDPIVAETPYGSVEYRVSRTRIVSPDNTKVLRPAKRGRDGSSGGLALTSCHPVESSRQRIVVLAEATHVSPAPRFTRAAAQAVVAAQSKKDRRSSKMGRRSSTSEGSRSRRTGRSRAR